MKCSETEISIAEDVEACNTPISTITNGPQPLRTTNHQYPSNTNGSIITMTLKNNHLIVETEERSDIQEDSRETKMTYSPSARDGVFVVEVQQGSKRSPGSGGPSSCIETIASVSISDQCALVHNPPDRYSDDETLDEYDETEYYVETSSAGTNGIDTAPALRYQSMTGLCQSNRSISSATQTYTYGNQQGYGTGSFGYPSYNGYFDDEEPQPKRFQRQDHKPKIISEIYKTNSILKASFDTLDDLSNGVESKKVSDSSANALGTDVDWTRPNPSSSNSIINEEEDRRIQEEQRRLGNTKANDLHKAELFALHKMKASDLENCQTGSEILEGIDVIANSARNEMNVTKVV